MTYIPTIPTANQSPQNSQAQIQTNFAQWASVFSTLISSLSYNHTAMNARFQGDHESILLQRQPLSPGVTQDLVAFYAKNTVPSTQPQIFIQIPQFLPTANDTTIAPNAAMQLTYGQVNTTGPNQFQSFLPGGYVLYFGKDIGTTVKPNPISDTITLSPVPSKLLLAIAQFDVTIVSPLTAGISTNITSSSTFTINVTTQATTNPNIPYIITWMALAVQ